MNNKGQVLITFVITLPILIMVFAIVVDLGLLLTETEKVRSTIKETIEYGLNSNNEDKQIIMEDMIKINLKDINKYEVLNNEQITISVSKTYKSIFGKTFKKAKYNYTISYIGYKENNQNVIKEK